MKLDILIFKKNPWYIIIFIKIHFYDSNNYCNMRLDILNYINLLAFLI
jgi:hypothetical protein